MIRKPPPDESTDAVRWRSADLRLLEAGTQTAHAVGSAGGVKTRSSRVNKEAGEGVLRQGRARVARPELSLKGRALRFLSQREHSRFELGRKLARFEPDADVVNALLDTLERDRWLSSERFVDSVVHRRAQGFGLRRIKQELGEHRLQGAQVEASLAALRDTEFERAMALWNRRFDAPAGDLKEKAKQHRYLAARGFDGDVIAKVLRAAGESAEPDAL